MARIQLASNLDDARGKIGNIVYSKGRSVHTQRKRVKPTNPQTSYQNRIRSLVAVFSAAWRSLDPAFILSWNQAALQQFKSNIFGSKYHTTGHKLFIATNVNAALVDYTSTIYGPSNPTHPSYSAKINLFDANSGGLTPHITLQVDQVPSGAYCVIEGTPYLSPGISSYKRRFVPLKLLKTGQGGLSDINIKTEWTARFGSMIAGKKIAIRSTIVYGADFQKTVGVSEMSTIIS